MLKIFFLIYISIFLSIQSADYKYLIFQVNELVSDNDWDIVSINDYGQMVGRHSSGKKAFVLTHNNEFLSINSGNSILHPKKINNRGQILCGGSSPCVWDKNTGFTYLNIFNCKHVFPKDLNNLGQVIGEYKTESGKSRPFLWDNGVATDMGANSEFAKLIEISGYHVMDVRLGSINNEGYITGEFSYGKFNKMTNEYVQIGTEIFLWNGDLHIIPFHRNGNTLGIKLNNAGIVMMGCYSDTSFNTYLWDSNQGLRVIEGFLGQTLNDACTILGYKETSTAEEWVPAIWKNGNIYTVAELLDILKIDAMAPSFSDTYAVEGLCCFVDINNKDEIACKAWIWLDKYPCLLEPNKK